MKLDPKAINNALTLAKKVATKIDPGFGGVKPAVPGIGVPLLRKSGGRAGFAAGGSPDPSMAPDFADSLYSHGQRVAETLPPTAQPEQMRSMLQQNGVKGSEMKWSGVNDDLSRPGELSSPDVARAFSMNMAYPEERVLRTVSRREFQEMKERHQREQDHLFANAPEDANEGGEALRKLRRRHQMERRNLENFEDTYHEYHTLPGGKNYREILLRHPTSASGEAGYSNRDHFGGEPNIIASLRMKDRIDEGTGAPIAHLEELQSDWGQGARHGYQGQPEKTAARDALKAFEGELKSNHASVTDKPFEPFFSALMQDRGKEHDSLRYDAARERQAMEGRPKEPAPFIDKTEDWAGLGLKRALFEAAHGGHDKLAWTPGEDQYARFSDPREPEKIRAQRLAGMKSFYDQMLPKRLLQIARQHDPEAHLTTAAVKIPHGEDFSETKSLPALRITDRMRESIKKNGFPMYQRGGAVDGYADGGEADGPMGVAAARENAPGITVSPRPGKMGGYPVREGTMDEHAPWSYSAEQGEHMPSPPPVQEPVYNSPRLDRLHKLTSPIFKGKGFNDLVEDLTGLRGLRVNPIHGMWMGEAEPSFHISHPDLTSEHVKKLAPLLGFGFQQDAVVHHHHNPDPVNEGAPTYYIGKKGKLSPEDMEKLDALSSREGIAYSTTNDGKGVKFSHFGDDGEGFDRFHNSVTNVANEMGFPHRHHVRTTLELQNAQDYLPSIFGSDEGDGGEGGLHGGAARSPDLFGRIVDHVLAPYAKAIASEGYRLSPERLAETYGLTPEETDRVRSALLPKGKVDRTTVPLMNGEEQLDVRPTGKGGKTNVGDVLFALQNRAARQGMISPTDYSKDAKEKIAGDIASEVKYHTDTAGKSAIGWYDSALKSAMGQYENHFPELKSDKSAQAAFKAILGITSQGQDVYQNSGHTVRAYDLLRKGVDLPDVVKQLRGTFGDKTRAIENNLLKLHDVAQKVGGYDALGGALNKKMTASEWNKLLRQNPNFHFNGTPLQVKGGANQKVTGWSVFGPKIGSFINNLNGDYSTLTADLWFSRTWNRLLGHNFDHAPAQEAKQYRDFRDALLAEHAHHNPDEALPEALPHKTVSGKVSTDDSGNPQPWMYGNDVGSISRDDMDKLVNDPDKMLSMAQQLEGNFRKGGYKGKSDLRRRAKNWVENRENSVAAPRNDSEREFQQGTVERAQKMLKNQGLNISIADIQAALWFHEKDLFNKLGVASEKAKPADYADAATKTLASYVSRNKGARPKKYIGGALIKPTMTYAPRDAAQKALLIAKKMRYS